MADWQTISALATAGGTLVLAVATFGAIRSANRSARVSERALLAGMRPLLVQSLNTDPVQKALWSDRHVAKVEGGRAVAEHVDDVIYLVISVRNVGAGIALLHAWNIWPDVYRGDPLAPEAFRRLAIDSYVGSNAAGIWESALRDPSEEAFIGMAQRIREREPFTVDLLYGDQEGGQRTITRFMVLPYGDDGWFAQAPRHWNIDNPAPR
ncbi:MAG TPA: hypothetical protein VHC63_10640 [Acidimicrobiales bacterium]|nr:hypothetical protein [Acidimicrobiales bacterium]